MAGARMLHPETAADLRVLDELDEYNTRFGLIDHLGETDFRLSEGADADIQMDALLAQFVQTGLLQ